MNLTPSRLRNTSFRITVDDLGLFQECEDSVLELSGRGIALYASWLTNFLAPSSEYLKKQKTVFNGLHLNLLEGRSLLKKSSLVNDRGLFCKKWWDFLVPTKVMKRDVEAELENQILVAKSWFGNLSHIDSHLHLHSIPWIYALCEKMAERFSIPYIRNPYEPLSDSKTLHPKIILLEVLRRLRKEKGFPCYGISVTFSLDAGKCLELIKQGQSREFVFHTCVKVPSQIPEASSFVTIADMEKRFKEHLQLSLLLDKLKQEVA